MKIVSYIVGILFLCIVLSLVVPSFINWNKYKPQIIDLAHKSTGLNLELNGDLKFSLLPSPQASISKVVIKSSLSKLDEPLLSVEEMSLSIDIKELLSGHLKFESILLDKPKIYIERSQDRYNWQTSEILALTNKGDKKTSNIPNAQMKAVSFSVNQVSINDASFVYKDLTTKKSQVIENFNANLSADDLYGPYIISASSTFAGIDLFLDANTGQMTPGSNSMSLNTTIIANDIVEFKYSGVIDYSEKPSFQGEVEVAILNFKDVLSKVNMNDPNINLQKINLKGMASGNLNQLSFQDFLIKLDDQNINGKIQAAINPLSASFDFQSSSIDTAKLLGDEYGDLSGSFIFSGAMNYSDESLRFKDVSVQLGNEKIKASGQYRVTDPQMIDFQVVAQGFDLDRFFLGSKVKSKEIFDPRDLTRNLEVPMPISFDVIGKSMIWSGSKFDFATKGEVKNNILSFDRFSLSNGNALDLSLSGDLKNIKQLSDLDLRLLLGSNDLQKLGKLFNFDISLMSLPFNEVKTNIAVKGGYEDLSFVANTDVLGATINSTGRLNPLTLSLDNVELQVKHPNTNSFISKVSKATSVFPSLNGPLDIFGKVDLNNNDIRISDLTAKLANISMHGDARIAMDEKPQIKGSLEFGDTVWESALTASSQGHSSDWSSQKLDNSWMNVVNLDFNIKAKSLDYDGWKMNAPEFSIKLADGALDIPSLIAGIYDGTLTLNASLQSENKSSQALKAVSDIKLRNVSLEPLILSLTGGQILKGLGTINLDTKLSTLGDSPKSLMQALSGSGATTGENIVLKGVDVVRFARALSSDIKAGDSALNLWKGVGRGGSSEFEVLDGDFSIDKGIVSLNKMDLDGEQAYLATKGSVNLPQFTIATRHEITLKEYDIPPFEIEIKGPLNNPAQTFGQGVLEDYISRKIKRKLNSVIQDKLGDKLGGLLGGATSSQGQAANDNNSDADDQNSQKQPQKLDKEEAIKGLLRGLLR